jgi:hypothetical protein
MSLDWSIDHGRRLVAVTLGRSTTEEELYRFLGEVITEGAMPYGKVFDASSALQWITASRIGPIAATARLYGRMGLGPVGPLAIIVAGEKAMARAREFALLSDASRMVRIFDNRADAEAWVAAIGGESEHERGRT